MSTSSTNATGTSRVAAKRRLLKTGLAATLLLSCSSVALHAESNADLAKEIAELKAQIHEMKGALAQTRGETRRTAAKIKAVASHGPDGYMPGYANPIPAGATPAFVTADKKFQFGALTITPGGFVEAAGIFRSKSLQADLSTPFNNVPFANNSNGHLNEFRPSARGSRVALLVEAPISATTLVSGYGELDFNAAAPTANENQTNSYQPRIRHLYSALDMGDYGLHFLAGQTWSLVTLNTKGITPRNELTPNVIDQQQTVGSVYARQAQFRLTKDFNKKFWAAVSVEESQTTGCPAPVNRNTAAAGNVALANAGVQALANGITATCSTVGQGGSFIGAAQYGNAYSFDHLPDVIGKLAYETKVADRDVHLEAFGVATDLYDRVNQGGVLNVQTANIVGGVNSNKDTMGWGVGGGIVAALIPKRLDFQLNGLYGRGIQRYGAGQLSEASFNPDGSLRGLEGYVALAGLTFHATPAIDFYLYGGAEGVARSFVATNNAGTTFTGVGQPGINNTGCFTEGGTCNGQTKRLLEITGGFWDKLYAGNFGEVRAGVQYAYLNRQIFNAPAAGTGPSANDHMVMTSFRYYPFAAPAAPPPVVAKY